MRRSKQGAGRETDWTWDTHLYYDTWPLFLEYLGVLRLRPNWLIQTKKSRILVNSKKVLSKRCTRGRPWEVGKIVYHKGCWGSHIKNLHLLVTLQAINRECMLTMRGLV